MKEPYVKTVTNVEDIEIADGINATIVTGFVNIEQTIEVEGHTIFIQKVLPFSDMSVAIMNKGV